MYRIKESFTDNIQDRIDEIKTYDLDHQRIAKVQLYESVLQAISDGEPFPRTVAMITLGAKHG